MILRTLGKINDFLLRVAISFGFISAILLIIGLLIPKINFYILLFPIFLTFLIIFILFILTDVYLKIKNVKKDLKVDKLKTYAPKL